MNTLPIKFIKPSLLNKKLAQDSLYEFVKQAWHVVEPSTQYVDGFHIKAICDYLEACSKGQILRLIINIPPRHMKSLLVNVFFPAWIWTTQPYKKFIFTSYGENLAIRDSIACRKLILSDWYQSNWKIELRRDQNQNSSFENLQGGYRKSFGFGGGVIGEGGDYVCIDDPLKPQDAHSDAIRNTVNATFDSTISSRLNDPKTGVIILIMQRLHQDDLTGHLLDSKEKWEHLCLPAEYEGIRFTSSINFVDPRKNMGDLLWPERFGEKEIQSLKNTYSELDICCQLQQRPSLLAGNIYQKKWFINRINNTDIFERWISVDTADTNKEKSDYSAFAVGELRNDYSLFIREVLQEKVDVVDQQKIIEELANRYKYKLTGVVIEAKASGNSLVSSLTRTSEEWLQGLIVAWNPGQASKEQKWKQSSLYCEKGLVLLPAPDLESYKWVAEFEKQFFNVPQTKNDDMTDAVSNLIIYLENALAEGLRYRNGVNKT